MLAPRCARFVSSQSIKSGTKNPTWLGWTARRACHRHMPLPGTSPFWEGIQVPGGLFGALHVSWWAVCHPKTK